MKKFCGFANIVKRFCGFVSAPEICGRDIAMRFGQGEYVPPHAPTREMLCSERGTVVRIAPASDKPVAEPSDEVMQLAKSVIGKSKAHGVVVKAEDYGKRFA